MKSYTVPKHKADKKEFALVEAGRGRREETYAILLDPRPWPTNPTFLENAVWNPWMTNQSSLEFRWGHKMRVWGFQNDVSSPRWHQCRWPVGKERWINIQRHKFWSWLFHQLAGLGLGPSYTMKLKLYDLRELFPSQCSCPHWLIYGDWEGSLHNSLSAQIQAGSLAAGSGGNVQ